MLESEDERGEDLRSVSVNLFLVTMNHNGFKLMARDGISYHWTSLDSQPRISLSSPQ